MEDEKQAVLDFWDAASCGEVYAVGPSERDALEAHAAQRLRLEPYIVGFARFWEGEGRDVLEIGVGMGADHLEWATRSPRRLAGIDLTPRAVDWTRKRLELAGAPPSDLRVADADALPFHRETFDIVYSWGVLHHSPDTAQAVREVRRVLRPGGQARVMIYHRPAVALWLLWARYALAAGRPWRSLRSVAAEHLESPGTQAFTRREARRLFAGWNRVRVRTKLAPGDLLTGAAGQRHEGRLLRFARAVWPRWILHLGFAWAGLYLLIDAVR